MVVGSSPVAVKCKLGYEKKFMNSMVTTAGILAKTPKILSNSQNELIENVVFSFLYACKLLSLSISCFKMVSYLSTQRDQTEHAIKMLFNHEGRLGNRKQTFFIFFFCLTLIVVVS